MASAWFIVEKLKARNSVLRGETGHFVTTFNNDYSRLLRFAALFAGELACSSENRRVETT